MAKERISSCTMADIQKMIAEGDYWPTSPDAPEIELDEDFWQNARIVMPKSANQAVSHQATRRMAEESSDDD